MYSNNFYKGFNPNPATTNMFNSIFGQHFQNQQPTSSNVIDVEVEENLKEKSFGELWTTTLDKIYAIPEYEALLQKLEFEQWLKKVIELPETETLIKAFVEMYKASENYALKQPQQTQKKPETYTFTA